MRILNKTISFEETVQIQVEKNIVSEEIMKIVESKFDKTITVYTELKDENGIPVDFIKYEIKGEKYDLLMSDKPDFAPEKPFNEYREIDIWSVLEM